MKTLMRGVYRAMGLALALLVIVLLFSGIFLNHARQLGFDQRYVNWEWLMTHYGIGEAEPDAVYLVDDKIISQFDSRLFVNAEPVTYIYRPLLGGIALEDLIVLATDNGLILLDREGAYVDRLGAEAGIPGGIRNIGVYHGEPVLQARSGMWRSNFMLDVWEPISLQGVTWSDSHPMPDAVAADLKAYFYGRGVSVEKLILDIHNGRILGNAGIWLIDILGIFLMVLTLTGLLWWGRRLR